MEKKHNSNRQTSWSSLYVVSSICPALSARLPAFSTTTVHVRGRLRLGKLWYAYGNDAHLPKEEIRPYHCHIEVPQSRGSQWTGLTQYVCIIYI